MVLLLLDGVYSAKKDYILHRQGPEQSKENIKSHSCIHDQIIQQRKRPGHKIYSVSAQLYDKVDNSKSLHHRGRALLGLSESGKQQNDAKHPIRIYLNYDAVGHSSDRDCRNLGDIVKASICKNHF